MHGEFLNASGQAVLYFPRKGSKLDAPRLQRELEVGTRHPFPHPADPCFVADRVTLEGEWVAVTFRQR